MNWKQGERQRGKRKDKEEGKDEKKKKKEGEKEIALADCLHEEGFNRRVETPIDEAAIFSSSRWG